jgi:diguanylate cyclase (GGDEF)-like protein
MKRLAISMDERIAPAELGVRGREPRFTQIAELDCDVVEPSRFDALSGQTDRARLAQALAEALDEAVRYRSSCGLLLVAIDGIAHVEETYGFAASELVGLSITTNIRAQLRGGDTLIGPEEGTFAIVLKSCGPVDMTAAAERMLATARDTVVEAEACTLVAAVTIGGVVAPRHARTVEEILARARLALHSAQAKRCNTYEIYRPDLERQPVRC